MLAISSIEQADLSKNSFLRMATRSTYAMIVSQLGKEESALSVFKQAETIQDNFCSPKFSILYSIYGSYYSDFLISQKEITIAFERIAKTVQVAAHQNIPLDLGLDQVNLSRIYAEKKSYQEATQWVNSAVKDLYIAGHSAFIPIGLISRSFLNRKLRKFNSSKHDLIEVFDIAYYSGMRLHLTDYHLEMARLILAIEADPTQYSEATPDREQRTLPQELADPDEPGILTLQGHIQAADQLIQDTGYHRRDAELAELKQQAEMPC